jgi:hypothetical protein
MQTHKRAAVASTASTVQVSAATNQALAAALKGQAIPYGQGVDIKALKAQVDAARSENAKLKTPPPQEAKPVAVKELTLSDMVKGALVLTIYRSKQAGILAGRYVAEIVAITATGVTVETYFRRFSKVDHETNNLVFAAGKWTDATNVDASLRILPVTEASDELLKEFSDIRAELRPKAAAPTNGKEAKAAKKAKK